MKSKTHSGYFLSKYSFGWKWNVVSILIAAIVLMYVGCGETLAEMYDPVFGIKYNQDNIHFETAPRGLTEHCNVHDKDLRIYGKIISGLTCYYILSGYVTRDSDGNPVPTKSHVPDVLGFVASIHDNVCTTGSVEMVLNQKVGKSRKQKEHIHLTSDELSKLSADVVDRYISAFGGKAAFLKQLQSIDNSSVPPSVMDALKRKGLDADSKGISR